MNPPGEAGWPGDGGTSATHPDEQRQETREDAALRAARLAHEQLRALLDDAPDAVARFDRGHRVVFANLALARATGIPRERFLGRTPAEAGLPPAVSAAWAEHLREVFETGEPRTFELRLEVGAGAARDPRDAREFRDFEVRLVPEPGSDGDREDVRRVLAVSRDITDRKRAEEALRQREREARAIAAEVPAARARAERAEWGLKEADRRRNEILAGLSHDLRNPLAPIQHALWLLERAPPDAPEAARSREVIGRQVAHLARLLDDLLDVTRLGNGAIQLQAARLDVCLLARRSAEDHRAVFEHAGATLAVDLPAGPVYVDGDATRLSQAIGNLLQAAARATPRGGCARLVARVEGDEVLLAVHDPGAVAGRGAGIGLALVEGLVALHHGRVEVRGDDGATEVELRLPTVAAARPPRGAPAPAPRPEERAGAMRILVVEDNADASETLRMVLELDGHVVQTADSGRRGIAVAASFLPDVILCDLGLPDGDGYGVAAAVRAAGGEVPFLAALSGYASPEDRERSAAAGFDAHLAKPVAPERLRELLARAQAERGG